MAETFDWKLHQEHTKQKGPSPLLIKALRSVEHRGKALELGGGALNDSRYLLDQGFEVTDIDVAEPSSDLMADLDPNKFHFIQSTFADFSFPAEEYDLVSAFFSLPFNPPDSFDRVIASIKGSLRASGVFCGQLFGDRDEWSSRTDMTFHTIDQAKSVFEDMETLLFAEFERDAKLASGEPKHWHTYNFIARKRK